MGYLLSTRSLLNLEGVHPDLVKVVKRAIQITPIDFMVIEGMRTVHRQRELVAKGASKTMNSRHLTGHAVDLVPLDDNGKVSWDWPLYYPLAKAVKQAAKELGVPLEWGGDWRSFKDGPHWQLPFAKYPKGSGTGHSAEMIKVATAGEPEYTLETETQHATKTTAIVTGGIASAGAAAAEPLTQAAEAIAGQQVELTSGSWVRVAIAVVIVGATVYAVWKRSKRDDG